MTTAARLERGASEREGDERVDNAQPEVVAETRTGLENLKRKRVQLDDALKLADEVA